MQFFVLNLQKFISNIIYIWNLNIFQIFLTFFVNLEPATKNKWCRNRIRISLNMVSENELSSIYLNLLCGHLSLWKRKFDLSNINAIYMQTIQVFSWIKNFVSKFLCGRYTYDFSNKSKAIIWKHAPFFCISKWSGKILTCFLSERDIH